jgi:hypothetical protein
MFLTNNRLFNCQTPFFTQVTTCILLYFLLTDDSDQSSGTHEYDFIWGLRTHEIILLDYQTLFDTNN